MDYLHHSAGKHLWQFQLRDFLNPSCQFFFFFFFFSHGALPLQRSFPGLSRFLHCTGDRVCLDVCRVPFCETARLKLSMIVPKFLRSAAHWQSLFFARQRFLLLSHWFPGLVDRGCALLKRRLHRLRQTVNSALPSRPPTPPPTPPLTIHRGIKGKEGNDVKRQTGSWTPYYLGSVWRIFLKCSARSVLTAVCSWHHPVTTLTLQLSRVAEFSAWGPIENLHSETFSVVWVQRDLLAWACKGMTFKKVFL